MANDLRTAQSRNARGCYELTRGVAFTAYAIRMFVTLIEEIKEGEAGVE